MNRKTTAVALAVLVFAAALFLKGRERTNLEEGASVDGAQRAQQTEIALPRLGDLGSDKCIPCKEMAPILEELAAEYEGSLVVDVIDVRKETDAGPEWGIRVIPTQVFIDASGEEQFRHEGFMAKEAILEKWKELGVTLVPKSARGGEA